MSRTPAVPILNPQQLTPPQRQVLVAMAESQELWTIGNLFFVLRSHGIPTRRDELAALLGLTIERDEAAELAAQARFHRVHMHDPGEAATLLRRAVELAPDDALLWYQLAQALHAGDDNAEALLAVDRSLALDPNSGAAHFERGLIAVHTEPAAAAAAFARAAELGAQPLQARTNQSTCLAMIGRREEALTLLEQVTAEHPGFAEGWYSLGLALVKLGRHDASVTALDRAVALDPDHANAHYARACAHALAGRDEPALADVARAIAIDPGLRPTIRDDADFAAIADSLEFQRLVAGEPAGASLSDLRN